MSHRKLLALAGLSAGLFVLVAASDGLGQPDGPGFGKKGFGPGGPGNEVRKILKDFDKDGDGRLNADERAAAREALKKQGNGFGGFGGPKGKGGFGAPGMGKMEPPKPGPQVQPEEVASYPDKPLYDSAVLRTIFLTFENKDWEQELQDFHKTDVEVPATLVVDGKTYPNVGVHFRGMSSYFMVPAGYKRSLNVKLDFADKKQTLYGYKTLNLLNNHEDPGQLSTVLYSHVARQYIPAPKANLVNVVINGESWGVYTNVQQFDKVFVKENYKTDKGSRWKVRGNPGARGGLEYWGDDVEQYKRVFEIKSNDDPKAWQALIHLCKLLNETPPDQFEKVLSPVLDIDSLLWFLALDVSLINGDGYWTRSSDYSIYLDPQGKFHMIPSDMNEAFHPMMGPGGPGGPGGGPRMIPFGRPGDLLPGPLQDVIGLSDEQKQKVAELQKEVESKVGTILTDEQRKQLAEMRDRGPGGPGFGPPGGPGGFGPPGGPGGFGPPGGMGGGTGGIELDPLVNINSPRMPLRSKVLAVPSLRARYITCCKTIAEKSLDWKTLGPVVAGYRKLIQREMEIDTRKLDSYEEFLKITADEATTERPTGRGPVQMSLRAFADQRRKFLLAYQEPAPRR